MSDYSEASSKNLFLKPKQEHENSVQETELRRAAFTRLKERLLPALEQRGITNVQLMLTGSVSEGRAHDGSDIDMVVKHYETLQPMEEAVVMGFIRKSIIQLKEELGIPYQFNLHLASEQQGAINVQSLLRKALSKRAQ